MRHLAKRPVFFLGQCLGAALFAFPASLGTSAPAQAALERTTFGEWTLRCRENNYCIAETQGEAANGEAFRLKVERGAKPDSDVYVTLRPTTQLSEGIVARIEVEGEEDNYGFFGKASRIYEGNEMTFGGSADRVLLENLRLGISARIQIEFGGATGTLEYSVFLVGLTHALVRMDQEQGRIGRLDALVAWGGTPSDKNLDIALNPQKAMPKAKAKGEKTADAAPREEATVAAARKLETPSVDDVPPPIMPSQDIANGDGGLVYDVDEIPEQVQFLGYRGLNCELDEVVPAFGAQYYTAGDEETWIVPCQMADANIPYFMVRHVSFNPSASEWLDFETPPGFNQPNHALVNNLVYDPDTREVTGTTYHSPNYDCGIFERHEEMAESGEYELVLYLEKTACDGITGPPEGWPLSWTIDEMGG